MSGALDDTFPYRRAALGTNALKRLGRAIASGVELSDDERDLYEAFIADADRRRVIVQEALDQVLAATASKLPRAAVAATGRTKTLKTLREKLARSPHEQLPGIRDIAGVRVVADLSTLEQQIMTGVLTQAMGAEGMLSVLGFSDEPQLIDRLETPMNGYRAQHLVVRLDHAPVEIQIRTALQHSWAALMELLCDRWGREPRYGLRLVEPDPDLRDLKESVLMTMARLSQEIAAHEREAAPFGVAEIKVDWSERFGEVDPEKIQALIEAHAEIAPTLTAAQEDMKESLLRVRDTVSAIDRYSRERQP